MNAPPPTRLLSIGEFAAATQLSPKALRLYDEQDLIRPAVTDPANGYRYYRSAQVPTGRLIRTLREMNLPLAQIAQVVATQGPGAESLLQSLAQELDRRYAAEKRAFQSALMLLRAPQRSATPTIEVIERGSVTACVRPFFADRSQLIERFVFEARAAREVRVGDTIEVQLLRRLVKFRVRSIPLHAPGKQGGREMVELIEDRRNNADPE